MDFFYSNLPFPNFFPLIILSFSYSLLNDCSSVFCYLNQHKKFPAFLNGIACKNQNMIVLTQWFLIIKWEFFHPIFDFWRPSH